MEITNLATLQKMYDSKEIMDTVCHAFSYLFCTEITEIESELEYVNENIDKSNELGFITKQEAQVIKDVVNREAHNPNNQKISFGRPYFSDMNIRYLSIIDEIMDKLKEMKNDKNK